MSNEISGYEPRATDRVAAILANNADPSVKSLHIQQQRQNMPVEEHQRSGCLPEAKSGVILGENAGLFRSYQTRINPLAIRSIRRHHPIRFLIIAKFDAIDWWAQSHSYVSDWSEMQILTGISNEHSTDTVQSM